MFVSVKGKLLNMSINNYKQTDDWRQKVLTLWPCGMEQSQLPSVE